MDFVTRNFKLLAEDEDLIYYDGIAVQKDLNHTIEYGAEYFEKYVSYEGTPIALALNQFRVELTEKYCNSVLDIGIGSGEFIKSSKIKIYGFDINPFGVEWLKTRKLYVNPYEEAISVDGWTFWDSLEHFQDPQNILTLVPYCYVFISIPIFKNILEIKDNKHYRPDEHFNYFTTEGLINYMQYSGFQIIEYSDGETQVGRQSIFTFVFIRQS